MAREPKPFPWQALARVDRRTTRLADALAGWAAARPARVEIATPAGPLTVRGGRADVLTGPALSRALADPTSAVALVRARGATSVAYVVAGGALTRAFARIVMGGPDELDAPRPPTPAERGVLAYVTAAALAGIGAAAFAEPSDSAGPLLAAELGSAAVVELELDGPCAGWAVLVVPLELVVAAPARRARATPQSPWIDEPAIDAHVAIGAARLPRARAAALAVRDVIVMAAPLPAGAAELRIGHGMIAVALAADRGGLIVTGDYARGTMNETLGEDATVEIVACVGTVSLSVRSLLDLAPGQLLGLGKPLGGPVELRVGRQRVGHGELVDVDGELGVRVLGVEGGRAR